MMRASSVFDLTCKHFEADGGPKLKAYLCSAGVWTIANGRTKGVTPGMTCTPEQAELWFQDDKEEVERELNELLDRNEIELNQNQFDALMLLTFNLRGGPKALPKSAPKMWAALKRKDWAAAGREFLDMDKVRVECPVCKGHLDIQHCSNCKGRGKVLEPVAGLTRRRRTEAKLFLTPVTA